jgi:hypothetical protein
MNEFQAGGDMENHVLNTIKQMYPRDQESIKYTRDRAEDMRHEVQ